MHDPEYKMIITSKVFTLLGWKLNPVDSSDPLACW
jgi:hypothetical protein